MSCFVVDKKGCVCGSKKREEAAVCRERVPWGKTKKNKNSQTFETNFCFSVFLKQKKKQKKNPKAGLSRYPCETPGSESLCYRTSHETVLANKR